MDSCSIAPAPGTLSISNTSPSTSILSANIIHLCDVNAWRKENGDAATSSLLIAMMSNMITAPLWRLSPNGRS